jgi:hypothetical protein
LRIGYRETVGSHREGDRLLPAVGKFLRVSGKNCSEGDVCTSRRGGARDGVEFSRWRE